MSKVRHRVQFEIAEEVWLALDGVIPWGMRKHVFEALTISIIDYAREVGSAKAIGDLITNSVSARKLLERTNGPGNSEEERQQDDGRRTTRGFTWDEGESEEEG